MNQSTGTLNMNQEVILLRPTAFYAFLRTIGWCFLFLASIVLSLYFQLQILAWISLLIFLIGAYRYWFVYSIKYSLTPEQILVAKGVLGRSVKYLELYRISDYREEQSLIMRIGGIMNIVLTSFDRDEKVLKLEGIPHSDIAKTIRNYVQESRIKNRILTVDR
jgi:uncharacterized membrane protein YdbT with pleckstrin-like domain